MNNSKIFIGIVTTVCFIIFFSGCTLGKDAPNDNTTQSPGIIVDDGLSSLATDENGSESVTAETQSSAEESKEATSDTAEESASASIASGNANESIHTMQSVEESDETIEFTPIELSTAQSEQPATPSEQSEQPAIPSEQSAQPATLSDVTESSETDISSDIVITDEGEIILPLAP